MRTLLLADKTSRDPRSQHVRHPGGAELTDAAALEACPWPIDLAALDQIAPAELDRYELVVLGNADEASPAQIEALADHRCLVLFEHDVRICHKRGNFPACHDWPHRHAQRCVCRRPEVERLFLGARGAIYLTERQRRVYYDNPFFVGGPSAVLGSSLFGAQFFTRVASLRDEGRPRRGVVINRSVNAIKGYDNAKAWANARGITPQGLENLTPDEVLQTLSGAETFVYLPGGLEPAGRMPVEARLLGCRVVVNEHVGVAGEPFWDAPRDSAQAFLRDGPARFWRLVQQLVDQPRPRPPSSLRRGAAALTWWASQRTRRRWVPGPLRAAWAAETERRTRAETDHPPW